MAAETEKNIHVNHRSRLKKQFRENGLDGFSKYNVLEFLLFFAIPQGDTNPLAHRLLDQFGSLRAIFEAPYEELKQVEGVGDHCATLLKLIPDLARIYQSESGSVLLRTTKEVGEYLLPRYVGRLEETVFMLSLNNKYKLLGCSLIAEGNVNAVEVHLRKIVKEALKFNAACVIIAHNHPGGLALPSAEDFSTTTKIVEALQPIGITLIDHIIVADGDFVSLRDSGYL